MRHSNTLWMLAIVTAIFVLIFLNLVLGSVSCFEFHPRYEAAQDIPSQVPCILHKAL